MSAYEFKLQNVSPLRPTAPSSGGSDLARFISSMEESRANRVLEDQRRQQHDLNLRKQEWDEGADQRTRENQQAINTALLGTTKAVDDYIMKNTRVDDALLTELYASDAWNKMDQMGKSNYLADLMNGQMKDARFHNPDEVRNQIYTNLAQLSGGRLTHEELLTETDRRINERYKVLDQGAQDLLLQNSLANPNTAAVADGFGKLFGGSSGTKGTKGDDFSVSDYVRTQEEVARIDREWGVEKHKGPLRQSIRNFFDWGNTDIKEDDMQALELKFSSYGISPLAMRDGLNLVRSGDTFTVNPKDLINANPSGNKEADIALRNILNAGQNSMANYGYSSGTGGLLGGVNGQAALEQYSALLSNAQAQDRLGLQQALSLRDPRAFNRQELRDFYLGDISNPPKPAPENTRNPTAEKDTGGQGDAGSDPTDGGAVFDSIFNANNSDARQSAANNVKSANESLLSAQDEFGVLTDKLLSDGLTRNETRRYNSLKDQIEDGKQTLFEAEKQTKLLPQNEYQDSFAPEIMEIQDKLKNNVMGIPEKQALIARRNLLLQLMQENKPYPGR